MRWVTEYLRCEQVCRDLAGKLARPDDKRALELMAAGWAARAVERKRKLDKSKIDTRISFRGASSEHAA
jgi:hypothetical protein